MKEINILKNKIIKQSDEIANLKTEILSYKQRISELLKNNAIIQEQVRITGIHLGMVEAYSKLS